LGGRPRSPAIPAPVSPPRKCRRVWYIRGLSPRMWTCNLANHRFWPMGSTAYGQAEEIRLRRGQLELIGVSIH
jgi:hypothetical protein